MTTTTLPCVVAVTLLWLAGLGENRAVSASDPAERSSDPIKPGAPIYTQSIGTSAGEMAISGSPVTVEISLSPELWSKIESAIESPRQTVRLTISGVIPPAPETGVDGFSVFLNMPDASIKTSEDDIHSAGSVAFQPTGRVYKPQAFALDIDRTLKRLQAAGKLRTDKPIQVTLVPITDIERNKSEAYVPFKEVSVSITKPATK